MTIPNKIDHIQTKNIAPSLYNKYPDFNEIDQGLIGNGKSLKSYIDEIGSDCIKT